MKCPTCGNDNEGDANFCIGCGANLISGEASVGTELPMVGFGEAISRGFRNYFNFSGRATRAEYWWWGLIVLAIVLAEVVVDPLPGKGIYGEVGWGVVQLVELAVLAPSLALGARRLHDINRTGWWQLLWFVPLIGWIVLIVWAIKRGDKGPNIYGPYRRQATSTINKLLLILLIAFVGIWFAFGYMFTRGSGEDWGQVIRGDSFAEEGQYDMAIQFYDEAILLEHYHGEAYYKRGLAYEALGKTIEAERDFEKAIQVYDEAIPLVLKGGTMVVVGHNPFYQRGLAYEALGKTIEAERDFEKTIQWYDETTLSLDSDRSQTEWGRSSAFYGRALAYEALGKTIEAERDFAEAKELGYDP